MHTGSVDALAILLMVFGPLSVAAWLMFRSLKKWQPPPPSDDPAAIQAEMLLATTAKRGTSAPGR